MAIKFNVEPYYDDFNQPTPADGLEPREKYHRILFRPGHAVQARELTQLQSILQNQVTEFGRHFFKEGSMVIPGHVSVESKIDYIKLQSVTGVGIDQLEGLVLDGNGTGLKIKIVKAIAAADGDLATVFVKYLNSGTLGQTVANDNQTFTDGNASIQAAAADSTGFGSVCFVDEGIYFIEGNFVVVQQDSIVLEKYETDPSFDIGLTISEKIQTSAGDPSLNDNATGAPNYAAPGAHRYEIKTSLVKQANDSNSLENFILLARVVEGVVTKEVRQTDYSVLEETLARRTFDESGNYTVRPFLINVREHTDINDPGDESKLVAGLEPSKAYVRGYEIETLATQYINLDKARDTTLFQSASVSMTVGNYIEIENVDGLPDIESFTAIELRNVTDQIIGFARPRSIVYRGNGLYRLFLFDIEMNQPNPGIFENFDNVTNLRSPGIPEFTADLVLSGGKAKLFEANKNSMVFPLPFDRVKTCDSQPDGEPDDFNYLYFCNRLIGVEDVSGGESQFTTVGTQEQFEPFDERNWILTVASGPDNGTIVPLSSGDIDISTDSQSVTISGLGTYEGATVKLIAGVKRSLEHKSKSLTTNGQPNLDLYPITVPSDTMQLGKADGYKLRAVYMSADFDTDATQSDTDVTEYYDFDNGQNDNFYGISKIIRKSNTAFVPSGRILVKYEYFTHTGSGDFFSVDSYYGLTDSEGVAVTYEDIPNFISNKGDVVELRSVIDFRPRVSDAGTNFSGTGGITAVCPEPQTTFTTDIQYYLNRIDKIYLDKDGGFGVAEGVPALNPELPEDPKDSMVLYNIFIPGYTLNPNEVSITMVDNKRYTMRDIGGLEKRINRLEYYTSLSLLEKEAADTQVLDPATAVQRAKAGFIVDSFTSHNTGNVTSPEYRAAIDRSNRTLRPVFSEDSSRLVYNENLSTGVRKTGALVTLPYEEQTLVNQSRASGTINVNPFDVFEWTGSIELSPFSDEFKDTSRRPNVIVDQEGVYDAMLGIINETDALGTVWNEWQTNWSGSTSASSTTRMGRKITTTTTTTTTSGQSRRGIETAVVPDTITTNLGDRVVEINFAPYVRSRIITFKATRLKPNTQLFAFFDNVSVADYVRAESEFIKFEDLDNPVVNGKNDYYQHPVGTSTLTTDETGTVIGSFFVPNNEVLGFQTGTRIFKLCDSSINNPNAITTSAEAAYTSKGLIETKENVTISTRVPLIERREVSNNRIVTNTRTTTNVRWVDPLAQSFLIDTSGGVFLTSIQIYFASKSENVPVTLQIREMNQGLPTQTIVPFSEVTLNSSDVNVAVGDPNPATATPFVFDSPVYLQDNREYCFVLLANSNEYTVWYAGIGEDDYATGERISKQPYAGVLFKSQNASTWTPDQNKDLKFKLNRAEFDIDNVGTVVLNNGSVPPRSLIKNPFVTTEGSTTVRVSHRNHHMFDEISNVPSYVTIAGSTAVNGIPASEINGNHLVTNVEMDYYEIVVTTAATGSGIDGGTDVTATENQLMNVFFPSIQQLNFPGTNTTYGVRLTSGISLGATSPVPYVTDSSFNPLIVNQNYYTDNPKVIASSVNEQSGKTFFLRGNMASNQTNLSPVIDLERCSVVTVANRIDNPTGASVPLIDRPSGSHIVADYLPETSPSGGSVSAKYVTKKVKLAEAADGIRIFFDANRPSQTDISVYVKTAPTEEQIGSLEWVEINSLSAIPFSEAGEFTEVEYVYDPDQNFTIFEVKIVYTARNSSRIPLIRDLRIITLAP